MCIDVRFEPIQQWLFSWLSWVFSPLPLKQDRWGGSAEDSKYTFNEHLVSIRSLQAAEEVVKIDLLLFFPLLSKLLRFLLWKNQRKINFCLNCSASPTEHTSRKTPTYSLFLSYLIAPSHCLLGPEKNRLMDSSHQSKCQIQSSSPGQATVHCWARNNYGDTGGQGVCINGNDNGQSSGTTVNPQLITYPSQHLNIPNLKFCLKIQSLGLL